MTLTVLSVASEVFPLIKTGGLADVAGALPLALQPLGIATRTLMPGYPAVLEAAQPGEPVLAFDELYGGPARILPSRQAGIELLILDAPHLYDRSGGPYATAEGYDHPDNWARFAALARAGAVIAEGAIPGFKPDIVHAHDWQAALTPAFLGFSGRPRPKTVLTIHNLAFQGNFPAGIFPHLGLPPEAWSVDGIEYYGGVGYLKAGLFAADAITTVSPTYAGEILSDAGGMGLGGLLRARRQHLTGIVNGIDTDYWNPATDPVLEQRYSEGELSERLANKQALEREFGFEPQAEAPLLAVVSRLTWQKGMDLVAELCDALVGLGVRVAVVGTGEPALERAFLAAAARHPQSIGVRIGYSETLSHRVQAGADALLVPSRFEPCGLTQLYALRYGCVPVVTRVGGLADTIIDANFAAVSAGVATGVMFAPATTAGLLDAVERTLRLFQDAAAWRSLQASAMAANVGWEASALRYAELYRGLMKG